MRRERGRKTISCRAMVDGGGRKKDAFWRVTVAHRLTMAKQRNKGSD
jgi:hypothetical protein